MDNFSIVFYENSRFDEWNDFVRDAKNATFLFHRNFMEYHGTRFDDYSLMIYEGNCLVAILPAVLDQNTVKSHPGLTYGGLVCKVTMKLQTYISVFEKLLCFLEQNGIQFLELKEVPFIYTNYLADELQYLAFLTEAVLTRCDVLSVIDLDNSPGFSTNRKRMIKRAKAKELSVVETADFTGFWNEILIPNLWGRYQKKPVHTVEEMNLLKSRFPDQIRQFNVYSDRIIGGVTVFVTPTMVHLQYISGLECYNNLGGLDLLQSYLIEEVFADKKFFDFGISNEEEGRKLNKGLLFLKESYGARAVVQHFYRFETKNYFKLQQIWI